MLTDHQNIGTGEEIGVAVYSPNLKEVFASQLPHFLVLFCYCKSTSAVYKMQFQFIFPILLQQKVICAISAH